MLLADLPQALRDAAGLSSNSSFDATAAHNEFDRVTSLGVVGSAEVPNDDQIRPMSQVTRIEAGNAANPPFRQARPDRRLESHIAAAHLVPHCRQQTRQRAHARSRNRHHVDAHE